MRDSCVPVLAVWRAGLEARVPVFANPMCVAGGQSRGSCVRMSALGRWNGWKERAETAVWTKNREFY